METSSSMVDPALAVGKVYPIYHHHFEQMMFSSSSMVGLVWVTVVYYCSTCSLASLAMLVELHHYSCSSFSAVLGLTQ